MPHSRGSQEVDQIDYAYLKKLIKLAQKKPTYVYRKIWPQIKTNLCEYIEDMASHNLSSRSHGLAIIETILMCDIISLEERIDDFTNNVKDCLMKLLEYDCHGVLKKVLQILVSVPFPVRNLLTEPEMKKIVALVFCKNVSTGLEAAKTLQIIRFNGAQPSLMDLIHIYVEAENDSPMDFVNVFFESFKFIKWQTWCLTTKYLLEEAETTDDLYLKYIEILTAFIRKSCQMGNANSRTQPTILPSIQRKIKEEYTVVFSKDIVKILKDSQKFMQNDRTMHFVIDLIANFVFSLLSSNCIGEILEEFVVIWNRSTSTTIITTICKIIKHVELFSKNNEEMMLPIKEIMKQLHHDTFTQVTSQTEFREGVIISNIEEFKLYTVGHYFPVDTLYSDIWDTCVDKLQMFISRGKENEVKILLTYMSKSMEKNLKEAFMDLQKHPEFIDTSLVLTIKKSFQKFLPTLRTMIRNEQIKETYIGEACAELAKISLIYFKSDWARSDNSHYKILLPDGLIFRNENYQPLIEEYLNK